VIVVAGGNATLYALKTLKAGTGTGLVTSKDGYIYCGQTCSYDFMAGSNVALTATPGQGSTFSAWAGCDSVQGNVCNVSVSGAKNVTATFDHAQVTLTSLVLKPASVKGGNVSIATVTLAQPAPPGALGIGMSSDHPQAVQPPSLVIIPPGRTSFSFAVRTTPVRTKTVANVTATANSSHASATLTVNTGLSGSQPAASTNAPTTNAPTKITSLIPNSWNAGATTAIVINGTGFGNNPTVSVTGKGVSLAVTTSSDTQIMALVTVAVNAPAETATVTVSSNSHSGRESSVKQRSGAEQGK
jgi:hypothetical protein